MNNLNFASFGKNISATFTPFAQRTQQFVKEQLGQVEEKTELPPDYVALEKRCDALRTVHTSLLAATSQYSNESYDYSNIRESFTDATRNVSERVKLLSSAGSVAQAQAAITAAPTARPAPKTFNHAMSRAALTASTALVGGDELVPSSIASPKNANDDAFSTILEKYAVAQEKVGEARLYQDSNIQNRFLAPWQTTLNTSIGYATKARKAVDNARLSLDSVKSRARGKFGHEAAYDEKTRQEIEKAEDEFVNKVEEASGIMRNCLDTPEPLRNLLELAKAQREFYETSGRLMKDIEEEIESAQAEQEANYRRLRGGGA